jgi:hypothetical protein
MRFIFGILVCLLAPEALAQNCVTTGSIASCDNGLSGIESGGITFWSDGTSTWSGNMTFDNDGRSFVRSGNTNKDTSAIQRRPSKRQPPVK